MEDLRGGVATEITDACGLLLHCCSQLFGGDELGRASSILELVVLAIEAIEGTGVIEDGQVVVAMLGAAGDSISGVATAGTSSTDKISHAIRGQGIIVVGKISLVGATTF